MTLVEELTDAYKRITAVLAPLLNSRELNAGVLLIALVDVLGGIVGTARKQGSLTDDDVRSLSERFDVQITRSRR